MVAALRRESDFARSQRRVVKSEHTLAKSYGFAVNKQGQSIIDRCLPRLEQIVDTDRASGRHNEVVWQALRNTKNQPLRLLVAGISVAASKKLGTNYDGQKTLLETALWIGHQLLVKVSDTQERAGQVDIQWALRVGVWGID